MTMIKETFLKHVQRSEVKGHEVVGLCPFHADQNASWSGNIDSGLWICFGCNSKGDLKSFCEKRKIPLPEERLVATYEYKDEKGELLYIVERWESAGAGKTFKQKRWNKETNSFEGSLGDVRRVLYRLPEVVGSTSTVWLVEGEKCAERLEKALPKELGVVTCSPGGANNWRDEFAAVFDSREVIIIPDNDGPGQAYATKIVDSLRKSATARAVRVVTLPGLRDKEDIYDWLEAGYTVDELQKLVAGTAPVFEGDLAAESVAALLEKPWAPPRWMIDQIWMEGRGFVAGEPGVGKTWLTMAMAMSVSTGAPFLGTYPATITGPTLFVQEEESEVDFRDKLGLLQRGLGIPVEKVTNMYHLTQKMVQIPDKIVALIRAVKRLGAVAVFVDSFREVFTGDENDSKAVKPILDAFRRLQNETGASVVLVHHLNKPSKNNEHLSVFNRLRGSSSLWAWRQTVIGMTPADAEGAARIQFQFKGAKARVPCMVTRELTGEGPDSRLVLSTSADERLMMVKTAVMEFLKENNGAFTKNGISKQKGVKGSGAERMTAMNMLEKEGLIVVLKDRRVATPEYVEQPSAF